MAIKRNPYYMRTLDDILPQLSKAKTISMGDATSGYWHIPLDLASSLLKHSVHHTASLDGLSYHLVSRLLQMYFKKDLTEFWH